MIDDRTRHLALYQFATCPFCVKTRRAIRRLGLNIELRDAQHDPKWRNQLLAEGADCRPPALPSQTIPASCAGCTESKTSSPISNSAWRRWRPLGAGLKTTGEIAAIGVRSAHAYQGVQMIALFSPAEAAIARMGFAAKTSLICGPFLVWSVISAACNTFPARHRPTRFVSRARD